MTAVRRVASRCDRKLRSRSRRRLVSSPAFHALALLCGAAAAPAGAATVVVDGDLGPPARHGLRALEAALRERGLAHREAPSAAEATAAEPLLVVGTATGSPYVASLVSAGRLSLSAGEESLAVRRLSEGGREILVVAGADDVGLMYALLEIADRVRHASSTAGWPSDVEEVSESPHVPVRSMAVLLHSEDLEKEWYYSEEYWREYFALLASARWNTFTLIFSHQTAYLSPLYAFHVSVEEHPEVRVRGLSDRQRARNLEMLRTISSLAQERGISFTLGIWQQIAWEGKHQGSRQESMVTGLTRENMHGYTYHALRKLLEACPGIDTVQLRINHESGIDYDEQTEFYRSAVFRAIRDAGRPILIENRNVGLLRETIDASLDMGLPTRVSHKYWGEHMVFPYHPTRLMWTYSYGDWLRYPQHHQNIYQVWSLGSHRLLVWGDPEYVRRFAPTTRFQNAVGFEICAPLSQKGYGNAPGAWRIFLDPEREHFRWEWERYWSWYTLFGRLAYDPEASDEIWLRQIRHRFGAEAAPAVARAYRAASRVIPLVIGMATSDYNMGIWPEKDMGGLINFFLHLYSFDPPRISSFMEAVRRHLRGSASAKLSPEGVATRLERTARECESALEEAARLIPAGHREFWATGKDFEILSGMARYFAHKIRAAYGLGLYYETGDLATLRVSTAHAEAGLEAWRRLSSAAEEIYHPRLVMGPRSYGHWKDNLVFVENDVEQLRHQEELFAMLGQFDFGYDFGPGPFTETTTIYTPWYTNGYTVEHRFRGVYPHSRFDPQQGFGWNTDARVASSPRPRHIGRAWKGSNLERLDLPARALLSDFVRGTEDAVFRVDLPEGHYQATLVITDQSAIPTDHGPMSVSVLERFGKRPILEDVVIAKGETLVERFNFNMTGSRYSNFRLELSAAPGADFILSGLTFTRVEPHIAHVPIRRAAPGEDVVFRATVTLPPHLSQPVKDSLSIARGTTSTIDPPDAITRVRLGYSRDGVSYRAADMRREAPGIYEFRLPGSELPGGELRYFIEAADSIGQVVHHPRGDRNEVYRVAVNSDREPPRVEHEAVPAWDPGRDLPLRVEASDPAGVERVVLYYRQTRQAMEYSAVTMLGDGEGRYAATIPGETITKDFDVMYYFEALDELGNGVFHPDPDATDPHLVVRVRR